MKQDVTKFSIFMAAGSLCLTPQLANARQNILTGSVTAGYEYIERDYDESTQGDGAAGASVFVLEDRRGDARDYYVSPRLTYSSVGETDLFEFTYSPRFVYDDLFSESDLDHDFGLHGEKNVTRNWLLSVDNRFFYGEDPYRESQYRTATIVPGEEEPVEEIPVVGAEAEEAGIDLTERLGRTRFWRNNLSLLSDYTYKQDSSVGVGYTFTVLRNVDDEIDGYTEYDRHDAMLRGSYRFNRQWRSELEGHYVEGNYDEPTLIVAPGDGDVVVEPTDETISDDLQEYHFRGRLDYDLNVRSDLFSEYRYTETDYDDPARFDSWIQEISLGWNYNINERLRLTLSGGPTFYKQEGLSTETDYNAYAGVTYDFIHTSFSFYGETGYDQENFDGRRSGLTQFWRTGADLTHAFSQNLSATLFASYTDSRHLEPPTIDTVEIEVPTGAVNGLEYNEDLYEGGCSFAYSFMRYYTLESGYRYYKRETDLLGDEGYNEHRVFIQLTASNELFSW